MLVNFHLETVQTKIVFSESFEEATSFFAALKTPSSEVVLLLDKTSEKLFAESIISLLQKEQISVLTFLVPEGEPAKTRQIKEEIENFLIQKNVGKQCCILALGGGALLDLAGFVASTYLRGVPFCSIPTTLLAMVDACLVGKTAINAAGMKNAIGSFYPAAHILISLTCLQSLPYMQMQSALAEIIKYGLIASPEIFSLLQKHKDLWQNKDTIFLKKLITLSLKTKKKIVEEDPKEKGLRRSLNFGHTIGHAIESLFLPSYSHGESVAIGLFIESYLSMKCGSLSNKDLELIVTLLKEYDFPLKKDSPVFFYDELYPFLILDKKNNNKTPRFVLLSSIGKVDPCNEDYCLAISEEDIKEALLWYNQRTLSC